MGQTLWQGLLRDLQLFWSWRAIGGGRWSAEPTEINTNWAAGHTINIGPHMVNQFTMGEMDSYLVNFGAPISRLNSNGAGFQRRIHRSHTTAAFLSHDRLWKCEWRATRYLRWREQRLHLQRQPDVAVQRCLVLHPWCAYLHCGRRLQALDPLPKQCLQLPRPIHFQRRCHGQRSGGLPARNLPRRNAFIPGPFSQPGTAGNLHNYKFSYFATYLQDDWKVTSKLTLNLGVRWDIRPIPYDAHNRMGWLDTSNALGGMCIADPKLTTDGIAPPGNGFYRYCGSNHPGKTELNNFAPRLGAAYRMDNKTVVRGGGGLFWDGLEGREMDDSGDIYPYVSRQNLSPDSGQASYQTTDQLWPSFNSLAPITGGPNGEYLPRRDHLRKAEESIRGAVDVLRGTGTGQEHHARGELRWQQRQPIVGPPEHQSGAADPQPVSLLR